MNETIMRCGDSKEVLKEIKDNSDDMLNDGSVTSIKQNKDYIPPNNPNSIHNYSRGKYSGINDKGTNSRYYDIDKWFYE